MNPHGVFSQQFLITLESLVAVHHSIYPTVPPQGIFFESLVEEAFKRIRKPFTRVQTTARNVPKHDLVVGNVKLSLKTETGLSTKPDKINITKLCTTEREPWRADVLIEHATEHLSRYDHMLMLRAVWRLPIIQYQIVDIPIEILRLIGTSAPSPVGKRKGRQSLGADVYKEDKLIFRVHFDGSDGKCQIRNLAVQNCRLLHSWESQVDE